MPTLFIRLTRHVLVGLGIIVAIWLIPIQQVAFDLPALGYGTSIQATTAWSLTLKLLVTLVTIVVVGFIHMTRDWGIFFPLAWDFQVYFDVQGLQKTVNSFSASEQRELSLHEEWIPHRNTYINHLNHLSKTYGMPSDAVFDERTVGVGRFRMQYHKISHVQEYKIDEGAGVIDFTFKSISNTIILPVQFELHDDHNSVIQAQLLDLLWRWSIVSKLTFIQSVMIRPGHFVRLANVTCPTRIRFLPKAPWQPRIGRTLYLVHVNSITLPDSSSHASSTGTMVPVAYAVNDAL